MTEKPIANQMILALLPQADDRMFLESLFAGSNWRLRFIDTLQEARTALRGSIGVVISEARLRDGRSWKDLLDEIRNTADCPPLIVVDQLADEALWAEVLNLGGFDVLMKPLTAKEVRYVVDSAHRIHEFETQLAMPH